MHSSVMFIDSHGTLEVGREGRKGGRGEGGEKEGRDGGRHIGCIYVCEFLLATCIYIRSKHYTTNPFCIYITLLFIYKCTCTKLLCVLLY